MFLCMSIYIYHIKIYVHVHPYAYYIYIHIYIYIYIHNVHIYIDILQKSLEAYATAGSLGGRPPRALARAPQPPGRGRSGAWKQRPGRFQAGPGPGRRGDAKQESLERSPMTIPYTMYYRPYSLSLSLSIYIYIIDSFKGPHFFRLFFHRSH